MFEFINRIPPLVRVPLRFGAIGGVLGFVLVIILYYIGRHPLLVAVPIFDFRVAVFGIFIYFILRELRDYHLGGLLFFWQGFIACGIFVILYNVITCLLIWIFTKNVNGFVVEYINLATNQLKTYPPEAIKQLGVENYEQSLIQLKSVTGEDLAGLYFRNGTIIGLFVSVILSVILRRQPQNP
ncbi:MAG: DUF4199 domain-containing protein [Bacteroidota bacterium]